MTTSAFDRIPVADVDSHISEPEDLWLSRLPSKWHDQAPQVSVDPGSGLRRWRVGNAWMFPVGIYAHAGWHEFAPGCPPTLEEADPATWNAGARLARMDEYGIDVQVLYPNVMGFELLAFSEHPDQEFALACVSAYNDFQTEFAATAPDRLIPITAVPFWNLGAAISEIERNAARGHRGILWANKFENANLPAFTDKHWDPVYSLAAEADLSINFHVGFSRNTRSHQEGSARIDALGQIFASSRGTRENPPLFESAVRTVQFSLTTLLGNAPTILELVTSDLPIRYPQLKFVSVESGFGYIPYLMEAVDWQWSNSGARDAQPDRPLPSEVFKRQCYGSFWFEHKTIPMLQHYPDNFMFETDFPHPTAMAPGPGSYALVPSQKIQESLVGQLSYEVLRKVLWDNAARLYRLERSIVQASPGEISQG